MPSWYWYGNAKEASAAFVAGGVNDGPKVDQPPQPEHPQNRGQDELQTSRQDAALHQLAKAGNEETADGGDDVAG